MNELDIFSAALELQSPEERARYLDHACGDNRELRRRIDELLGSHAQVGSFMNAPVPAAAPRLTMDDLTTEKPGTVIGPYKLLEQIGEGGFGVVFMAEQTQPVRRKVALKILKPGMDTRQVVARFESERQALAIMDHPNIAKVLDGGATASGRPYFVMDLVKGVPITEHCDQNHLTPRERLDLFVSVCHAVQHAHHKGIIHRDLKPSNVLVTMHDTTPLVKVIDFGVAKALGQELTDKTLFTGFAQMIGTPLYMSPEQAGQSNLDIDTRSDIYSLGVLLYELLTGTTPFDKERFKVAAYDEIRRIIREEEPPKPSTRLSESTDSLPSISAQRQTEPAKLTKLVRGELDWIVMKALEKDRNRRYETVNGFAMDVQRYLAEEPVAAGPPTVGYRLRKFARRNKGPVMAASLVILTMVSGIIGTTWGMLGQRRAKLKAESREAETRAVLEFVEDRVFAAARPKDQEGGMGYDVKLADAVKASLPFLDTSFPGHPLIEARLRTTLGISFLNLGEAATAAEQFEAARTIYVHHLGPDHADTLKCMHNVATAYLSLGRYEASAALHEEALALQKTKLGPGHIDTFIGMFNLATAYRALGRYTDAATLHEETLALRKAKLGMDHTDTLLSMVAVARCHADLGRHADAVRGLQEALLLLKAKLGPDHPYTLRAMTGLATIYRTLDRLADAAQLHEEALALTKARLGPDHPQTLRCMQSLAISYAHLKRHAEALKLNEETMALTKAKHGPDHPDTLLSMTNLAGTYTRLGRHADAVTLREEVVAFQKVKLGADHPHRLVTMGSLAHNYSALGRHAEAAKQRADLLALQKAKVGPDHSDTLSTVADLADNYENLGQFADALKLYREALAALEAKGGTGRPESLRIMNNLAWQLVTCADPTVREPKEALGLAKRLVELAPTQALYWNTLGVAQYRMGSWKESIAALQKSVELNNGGDVFDWFFLAMSHWQLGDKESARKWYGQAVQWMEEHQPKNEDFLRFRAEAEELLENEKPDSDVGKQGPK